MHQLDSRPIACKLADFGESRSELIQTQTLLASKSNNIDRGTVVYIATETFVDKMLIFDATISELSLLDVWALGMVFFYHDQSQPQLSKLHWRDLLVPRKISKKLSPA